MENWRKDARSEAIIVDLEALVPQDHLLCKIGKQWIMSGCMRLIHTIATTAADPARIRLFS